VTAGAKRQTAKRQASKGPAGRELTAKGRARAIVSELRSLADPAVREGQARFGIQTRRAFRIPIPALRAIARREGRDHRLAQELWASGYHEARILAAFVDNPPEVTEEQMEAWAARFDSWDLVDQCCSGLFALTPWAWEKAAQWAGREEEFVKRAGFALMAALAVHDEQAPDERFQGFFALIGREAADPRNFVKKAVNWALRQIGKRSLSLNAAAVATAERTRSRGTGAARWVASDALRELTNEQVVGRIRR
jgi:3-methyladenine DNA glycosylase AlkD